MSGIDTLGKTKNGNDVTLLEWLFMNHDFDEVRALFVNMDSAMKYLHEKGHFIDSFNPANIEILNNSINQIKFLKISSIPVTDVLAKKEYVRDDIFRSTMLQVGYYASCLKYMSPKFLKENFDKFEQFLPEGDIPYYRGIVERNACVYLCDYAQAKRQRDLEDLENMTNEGEGKTTGKSLVKSNGLFKDSVDNTNAKINDRIYSFDENNTSISNAAYVSFFIIPLILAVFGLIFSVLALLS